MLEGLLRGAAELLLIGTKKKEFECSREKSTGGIPQSVGCDRWWRGVLKQATAWRYIQQDILHFFFIYLFIFAFIEHFLYVQRLKT